MPLPFLVAEMQLKSKLHVTELEFIHLSFFCGLLFFDNIFSIIGSLINAYARELKLSNHDNENVSGKCNLTFLQSFLSH